jgi:DNA-binding MarR family transcriptional regulator
MSRGKDASRAGDPADQETVAEGDASALLSANLDVALAAVALTSAGAALKGMHTTDWFCLWHIAEAAGDQPVALGQLAELTGLTAGAITGVVDRLEAATFVRRERDPIDRRRWLVRVEPERQAEIYELYGPLLASFKSVEGRYDAAQREAILDFLRHTADLMRGQVRLLREQKQDSRRRK